jgi:NhaA family Na+:H+ antiporter
MKLTRLFHDFFSSEKTGGLVLLLATLVSVILANSPLKSGYIDFWMISWQGGSLQHWINDGLMAVFFLLIGLELEREIYQGELTDLKIAALPIFGAIGGMIIPAGIYLLLNYGTPTQSGAGIPMATDIAFAIGILSLLGKRIPLSLKVFLTALAIIDDLGAILIIALFYSSTITVLNLGIALGIFAVLLILNRLRIYNLIPYLIGGLAMWYFMSHSGVHPTITGVLLAFAIPYSDGGEKSPSYMLQHFLHRPVAFFVLPLFALANTGIPLGQNWYLSLVHISSLGILAGLVIGKPLGIILFTYYGVQKGFCVIPPDIRWKNIIGAGFLAGIGFTMSIFITLLAFDDSTFIIQSKTAILIASLVAGVIGYMVLKWTTPHSIELPA